MPIYPFTCSDCGKEFTLVLPIREYEKKGFACPDCKSTKLEQVISVGGVVTSKKS